jgi:Domain of unknown function (DUF4188)
MTGVIQGRITARIDRPFVVSLIGMRINRLLAFRKWVPVARAMGPMLKELYQHPEKVSSAVKPSSIGVGPPWSSTGARSRIWRGSPAIRTIPTFPHGVVSTGSSARTGRSASSTKRMRSKRAITRRSTTTCPYSDWPSHRARARQGAPANRAASFATGREQAGSTVSSRPPRVGSGVREHLPFGLRSGRL